MADSVIEGDAIHPNDDLDELGISKTENSIMAAYDAGMSKEEIEKVLGRKINIDPAIESPVSPEIPLLASNEPPESIMRSTPSEPLEGAAAEVAKFMPEKEAPAAPRRKSRFNPKLYGNNPKTKAQRDDEYRKRRENTSLWDSVVDMDFMGSASSRLLEQGAIPHDPNWELTEEHLKDIDAEFMHRFVDAESEAEYEYIKDRIEKEKILNRDMEAYGLPGTFARIGINFLDPTQLAIGAMSGGIGWLSRGERLVRAAKGGLIGSTTSAAVEGYLLEANPTKSSYDVVFAALIGGTLGGGLSALGRSSNKVAMERMAKEEAETTAHAVDPSTPAPTQKKFDYDEDGNPVITDEDIPVTVRTLDDEAEDYAQEWTPDDAPVNASARVVDEGVDEDGVVRDLDDDFGNDSAGAARASIPTNVGEEALEEGAGNMPSKEIMDATPVEGFAKHLRYDMAKQVLGNASGAVRYIGSRILMNPVGSKTSAVVERSATEAKRLLDSRYGSRIGNEFDKSFASWSKKQGIGWVKRSTTVKHRNEFMEEVGVAVRKTDGSVHEDLDIAAAVSAFRKTMDDVLQDAQRAGVTGFEQLDANASYVNRVFDHNAIKALDDEIGTDHVELLIAHALRKGQEKLSIADAKVIAKGYYKSIRTRGAGLDEDSQFGINLQDTTRLQKYLDDAKVGTEQADEIMSRIKSMQQQAARNKNKGTNAKTRLELDENTVLKAKTAVDSPGVQFLKRDVHFSELLNNNAEILMSKYLQAMTGRIALARHAGIKGDADWAEWVKHIKDSAEADGLNVTAALRDLEQAMKHLMGRSTELTPDGNYSRYSKMMRDWSYSTFMNQAGFPQLADLGNIFNTEYTRSALMQIPTVRGLFKSGRDMDNKLLQELAEWTGTGEDFVRNAMWHNYEEYGHAVQADGFFGKVQHGLRVANRVTSTISGMAPVNTFMQRTAGKAITQRFYTMAIGGKSIEPRRLRNMGISDEMLPKIMAHLKKAPNENGKITSIGFEKWTDLGAREAFITALHRESRRIVQENDISGTHWFQNETTGKSLFQFRTFLMQAHTRQLMHGLNMADKQAYTAFLMQSFFGVVGFAAQNALRYQALKLTGADDLARDMWRERANANYILPAAISRAAWASLAPMAFDTTASLLGAKPYFSYTRSSGLSYDPKGIPVVSLGLNAANSLATLGRSATGETITRADVKNFFRLMPFSNALPIQAGINATAEYFPKKKRNKSVIAEGLDDLNWRQDVK